MPSQSKKEDKDTKKRCVLVRHILKYVFINRMTFLMKI